MILQYHAFSFSAFANQLQTPHCFPVSLLWPRPASASTAFYTSIISFFFGVSPTQTIRHSFIKAGLTGETLLAPVFLLLMSFQRSNQKKSLLLVEASGSKIEDRGRFQILNLDVASTQFRSRIYTRASLYTTAPNRNGMAKGIGKSYWGACGYFNPNPP
ncbi:hypothetical protein L1987_09124 [Smallanthus sonchifolius]|uniref:Uncharacterized protein n=1 Tax=Smallanthus sonchifolius TaxID=185202 RepID=A0ACB9JN41_9ASTR|nr:hypothetical protein L1987_09124 [Smallanthus sonchifolius]